MECVASAVAPKPFPCPAVRPLNATEPIRRQAALNPGSVAYVTASGTTISYSELDQTIDAVARRVLALGLVPGQTAAIGLGQVYDYLVMALALGRVGIAFAPITLPAHLTDVAIVDRGAPGNGCARVVTIDACWPSAVPAPGSVPAVAVHDAGDAILMLCPSSGTTGRLKFTPMSHELALRRVDVRAFDHFYGTGDRGIGEERVATYLGPATAYGFTAMLHALCNGAAVAEPNVDAQRMLKWFEATGVTHLIVSPIMLQRIVDVLPPEWIPNVLVLIEIGGGLVPASLLDAVRQRLCTNLFVTYGTSECGRVARTPAALHLASPGVVGGAVAGAYVEVVDEHDQPVHPGVEGSVRIRGERCATCYVDNPQDTAAVFRNGWVYPGDRGVLAADGVLRIVGREDDIINRGGAKINPMVIEEALMSLGGLREVAVFGVPGAGFTSICAAIVPEPSFDGSNFLDRCRERLGTSAPVFVMRLHALPRNANGKVLRQELARIAIEASAGARAGAASPGMTDVGHQAMAATRTAPR